MKLLLVILSIAVVAQVCGAASIQRFKRETDEKQRAYPLFKEMLVELTNTIKTVLTEMPDTAAYSEYRQELENILAMYNKKEYTIMCFQKLVNVKQKMDEFVAKCGREDSTETRAIRALFQKHNNKNFAAKYRPVIDNANETTEEELMETC